MHPKEYERLAAFEESYWWFIAKRRLLRQCMAQYAPNAQSGKIVADVGCGTGATLTRLRGSSAFAFGLDYASNALKYCRRKHTGYIGQANILKLPLADNSLDLVTTLDVLYHQSVSSDEAALREIYRVLKPGGLLILTAPAFDFLGGPHDKTNLSARRYTLPQMRAKLIGAGFRIKKESYAFALLFPVAFLLRYFQRKFASKSTTAPSDIRELPPIANKLFLGLYQFELAWLKAGNFTWGTSILFVAEK